MTSSALNGANGWSAAALTAPAHWAWRTDSEASGDQGHGWSTHEVAALAPCEKKTEG